MDCRSLFYSFEIVQALRAARSSSFAGPAAGRDLVHCLDRQRRATLSFQETESIQNLARGPSGPYFNPAAGELDHCDFLAGANAQMFQEILAQGDLSLCVNSKRVH